MYANFHLHLYSFNLVFHIVKEVQRSEKCGHQQHCRALHRSRSVKGLYVHHMLLSTIHTLYSWKVPTQDLDKSNRTNDPIPETY